MITHTTSREDISVSSGFVTEDEIETMAGVLRKRYGIHAYATATRFAKEHMAIDDETHADAWARVAHHIFETTDIR